MKLFKKIILCFMAFNISMFVVNAAAVSDVDYSIEKVYIDSQIDFIGSMHIREIDIVKGSLNGYEANLNYKNSNLSEWEEGNIDFRSSSFYNARGVSLSKVSSFKVNDESEIDWALLGKSYTPYEEVDSANPGDTGVYTSTKTDDGIDVRIYNPNTSGYVVYVFDYYINQAVVLHNDVAELYWNFWPQNAGDVKEVNVQVTIPGKCTNDTFRFWAHGSLTGEIAGISEEKDEEDNYLYRGTLATFKNVSNGVGVDIRMTFDKSIMSAAEKILNNSGEDALDKIIEFETEKSNEANKQREMAKKILYVMYSICGIYIVGLIALWIYLYFKYDKEYNVGFNAKYYREFTGDYNVEVIDYLMKQDVTTNAMSASLMNMIYKKNIAFEEIPDDEKNLKLILKTKDGLNDSEIILVDLLFNDIGKNGEVTLEKIEKYSKKETTARKFMSEYNKWKNSVEDHGKQENFFENLSAIRGIGILYFILGIIIITFAICFEIDNFVLLLFIFITSLAFLIYTLSFKKWTKKGREHYLKWEAFRNFLKDFGSFKEKEVPEISLWERYLVYATVFGIAKEVQKAMKVYLTDVYDETYISMYPMFYRDLYIANNISDSISNTYSKSTNTISTAEAARSSYSSGAGFGGGSSFGGGLGGGGGSRGGF